MTNKFKKAFVKIHVWPPSAKAAITSALAIAGFIIGAILEERVQRIWGKEPGDLPVGLLWIVFALLIAVLWGTLQYSYQLALEGHVRDRETKERAIADARERITKLSAQHLSRCDAIMREDPTPFDEFRSVLICEQGRIAGLITAAWEVVNSHHNVSVNATERINFEMTLITPSLRDGELTIAAYSNRENLQPKSLRLREEGNTIIYRRTEAAKMIAKRVTETNIIEDTSDPSKNYEHLYEGQKERIRSSVLHPILSSKNEHLGVLVLHCERAGFFHENDRRYWHELFAVFAPPIALELERIKAFNKIATNWPTEATGMYQPY